MSFTSRRFSSSLDVLPGRSLAAARGWLWLAAVASSFFYGGAAGFVLLYTCHCSCSWQGLARSEISGAQTLVLLSGHRCCRYWRLQGTSALRRFLFNVSARSGLKRRLESADLLRSHLVLHLSCIELHDRSVSPQAQGSGRLPESGRVPGVLPEPWLDRCAGVTLLPQIRRTCVPAQDQDWTAHHRLGYFLRSASPIRCACRGPIFAAPADFESGQSAICVICFRSDL